MLGKGNYDILSFADGFSGATLLGVCLTQGLWKLLIASLVVSVLGFMRFVILKLDETKEKTPMTDGSSDVRMPMASMIETTWAMLVSYTVGTSLSPKVR